jgi:chemotaxis methyl-accepting protein methylase
MKFDGNRWKFYRNVLMYDDSFDRERVFRDVEGKLLNRGLLKSGKAYKLLKHIETLKWIRGRSPQRHSNQRH